MTNASGPVTAGIDIGTTATKTVAVDEHGEVVARARIRHPMRTPAPDLLEHDARRAWRQGPSKALAEIVAQLSGRELAGVCVAGMVPSLTAVGARGYPSGPGLLYGDRRGHPGTADDPVGSEGPVRPEPPPAGGSRFDAGGASAGVAAAPMVTTPAPGDVLEVTLAPPADSRSMPDAEGFMRWMARHYPEARGYWPAQAVANYALGGVPAMDSAVAMSFGSLMCNGDWDRGVLERLGVSERQLPVVVPMGGPAGTSKTTGAVLAGGTVDALCDQIVSGAEEPGDVLVICGATLVVWAVVGDWVEAPGLWTVPHTAAGRVLVGGPSNAGALFVDWARALLAGRGRRRPARPPQWLAGEDGEGGQAGSRTGPPLGARDGDPWRVPIWTPYVRGERAPFHDPLLRSGLYGLDLTHDTGCLERAAYEASGFVVRRMLDRAGVAARRIVASGGGTRVLPWMEALADATGLPVDVVAVHEGAAFGAAYLARMAAGLTDGLDGASRWARLGHRVEPDARWQAAANARYERFLAIGPDR